MPPEAPARTQPPPTRVLFVLANLLLLTAVPALQHLPSWTAGPFGPFCAGFTAVFGPSEDATPRFFQVNRRLQARMDTLERGLEDGSWVLGRTQGAVQWLLAGWGGAGNEKVYVGRAGWLVYRPGFDYASGPPLLAPDPRPAIVDFHRRLAARGVRLLVLPAPTKVMVHPEALAPSLAGLAGSALHNPSFAAVRAALEDAGVLVYDPTGTLRRYRDGGRAFLWTDSHWSPGAVDAVARELADRIRLLGLPFAGPEVDWRRHAVEVEGVGDLALALRLPDWSRLYPPEMERVERVAGADGRPWQADPHAEVLLLGDSFTNVFSEPGLGWGRAGGLAEQLAFHLRRAVDRIAVNNDGAAASRRRLANELAAGRRRLAGKQLVVWEFAVRELAVGDWQSVPLPAAQD